MAKRIVLSKKTKTSNKMPTKITIPNIIPGNIPLLEDQYNALDSNECKWATTLHGKNAEDCNFILESYDIIPYGNDQIILVKIPKGTKLYHATFVAPGEKRWFENRYPENLEKSMVWFASTKNHTSMINHNFLLTYITSKDMIVVFERNLKKYNSQKRIRGYEYLSIISNIKTYLHDKNIKIDGYTGCNECEIGIFNSSVHQSLQKEPIEIKETSLMYLG